MSPGLDCAWFIYPSFGLYLYLLRRNYHRTQPSAFSNLYLSTYFPWGDLKMPVILSFCRKQCGLLLSNCHNKFLNLPLKFTKTKLKCHLIEKWIHLHSVRKVIFPANCICRTPANLKYDPSKSSLLDSQPFPFGQPTKLHHRKNIEHFFPDKNN